MSNVRHYGNLHPNGNYTQAVNVRIPEFITGNYTLLIETDAYNEVYEYLSENNTNQVGFQTIVSLLLKHK